ncbi:MAG: OsmC family protein [Chloroflexota bacterium]|nr:OsmC family protein [Chloroflexota bacterium]
MDTDRIREAIERAIDYLSENPEEALYTDSPATATIQGGLRTTVRGSGDESVITDMPTSVGGGASAPSPGWFLRAAEASCTATLIAMRAAQLGMALETIEVTVDSRSDDRGILGIDAGVPAGPLATRVAVTIEAPGVSAPELEALTGWAVEHCPVTDAVRRAVPLELELTRS